MDNNNRNAVSRIILVGCREPADSAVLTSGLNGKRKNFFMVK
jgi:hypothetical protein